MSTLDIVLFLPLLGFLILIFLPKEQRGHRARKPRSGSRS